MSKKTSQVNTENMATITAPVPELIPVVRTRKPVDPAVAKFKAESALQLKALKIAAKLTPDEENAVMAAINANRVARAQSVPTGTPPQEVETIA